MPVLALMLGCTTPHDTGPVDSAPAGCTAVAPVWTETAPLPAQREGAAAAMLGDTLALVGGWDGGQVRADVHLLDTQTGTWSEGAPLPAAREHLVVLRDHGALVAIGGDDGAAQAEVWRRDSEAWTALAPLPQALTFSSGVVTGPDRWVVVGGLRGQSASDQVALYDADADTWTQGTPLPSPVFASAAVIHDGAVWVLGGARSFTQVTDAVWRAELASDGSLGPWMAGPSLPEGVLAHAAWATGDQVVVAGGFDWDAPSALAWRLVDDRWVSAEALPAARFSGATALTPTGQALWLGGWEGAYQSVRSDGVAATLCE